MKRNIQLLLATIALACALAPSVKAGPVLSRPALQALLEGPGTLEDFESFSFFGGIPPIGGGRNSSIGCALLNSTASCNGQGPGLVVPGIDIVLGTNGQWDDVGYYGAPSKEILSLPPLTIDFRIPIDAFGIDLRAFVGFSATATMTILGTDDSTVIGTFSGISLAGSGAPVFAGWEEMTGIGGVTFSQTGWGWSPIIDNLEFGHRIAAPEPSALSLFALGLVGLLGGLPLRCNKRDRGR